MGSLTIIRRNLTDSYAVIQELPTQARARTLAVNPATGEVYLVTNVLGFDLTHKGGRWRPEACRRCRQLSGARGGKLVPACTFLSIQRPLVSHWVYVLPRGSSIAACSAHR